MEPEIDWTSRLESLRGELDVAELEPDPGRASWGTERARLHALKIKIDALLADAERLPESGDENVQLRVTVARLAGDLAAAFYASGDELAARPLYARAHKIAAVDPLLTVAERDPSGYGKIVYARWRRRRGDERGARKMYRSVDRAPHDAALRTAARQGANPPQPIKSAPSLFTLNGCGVGVYGERDQWPDGSYVTNHCITLLFVPIIPLASYRVRNTQGKSYAFYTKEALTPLARGWRNFVGLGLLAATVVFGVNSYIDSPGHQLSVGYRHAAKTEQAGKTEAALGEYQALAQRFESQASADDLTPAADAVLRLLGSPPAIKQPFSLDQLDRASRLVATFGELPYAARNGAPSERLQAQLVGWATALGEGSYAACEGADRLLELAGSMGSASDQRKLEERRAALQTQMAKQLEDDAPLLAFSIYLSTAHSPAAFAAAGALLPRICETPSLLLEGASDLEQWLASAKGAPALAAVAATTRAQLDAAQARNHDAQRQSALETGDAHALSAALARYPDDQELMVVRAAVDGPAGQAAALSRLSALPVPTRTGLVERQVGELLASAGRLPDADASLSRYLAARLPRFVRAARQYDTAAKALQQRLIDDAKGNRLPADLTAKLNAAGDDEQSKLWREYVASKMGADPTLVELRQRYVSLGAVVPAALSLGKIKLERANQTSGSARTTLLDDAERMYLSIRDEAAGRPEYHVSLGQIYYRLGKVAEGEKELRGVSDGGGAEQKLIVAHVYRELGVTARARELALAVYNGPADGGAKTARPNAAVLLALLATDLDDREMWLKRCDPTNPFVERSLIEVAAARAFRDGRYADADAAYARSAAAYTRAAAHDASSANNAAVAVEQRYACTGDVTQLVAAVKLLDGGLALDPDSALITGNLVAALTHLGLVRVLDHFVDTRLLRPSDGEADTLVATLLNGPQRADVLQLLLADPSYRKSVDLLRQQEVLAPQNHATYSAERDSYGLLSDVTELRNLAQRLVAQGPLDASDYEAMTKRWHDADKDSPVTKQVDETVVHTQLIQKAAAHASPQTLGAATTLVADALLRRAMFNAQMADAVAAVAADKQAIKLWPTGGADGDLPRALLTVALLKARTRSAALDALMTKTLRDRSPETLLVAIHAEPEHSEMELAIETQPELTEAAAAALPSVRGRPALGDWLIAELANNEALKQATAPVFARDEVIVKTYLDGALHADTNFQLLVGVLKAKNIPRPF